MPRTSWDNAHVLSCMSSLLRTPEKEMTYLVKTCQQQGNEFDCGVFAIAFATSLANGEYPSRILYDKKKLRSHLAEWMAAKKLTLFPFSIIRKTRSREIAEKVEVYCVCRRMEYQLLSSTSASLEDWNFFGCTARDARIGSITCALMTIGVMTMTNGSVTNVKNK